MKRYNLSLLFVLLTFLLGAQNTEQPEMADRFRADGKIYVVIAVITIVFAAIVVFLTMLDRKITKIEKQVNGN